MIKLAILILLSVGLSACGKGDPSLPYYDGNYLGDCPQTPTNLAAAGFNDRAHLLEYLAQNKITQVNEIALPHLVQFASELKRIPASINFYLAQNSWIGFRILLGWGVADDPLFISPPDPKGRSWKTIPGAGGSVTRIVANRLYE